MQVERKIEILNKLGNFFEGVVNEDAVVGSPLIKLQEEGREIIQRAQHQNGWFTPEMVKMALTAWAESLNKSSAATWLKAYTFDPISSKKVGVIMAGNIPLVGLHDALCVLLSEHQLMAKLSSKDQLLMQLALDALVVIAPEWKDQIRLVERLNEIDALIATGSDNSARYFDYYFRDKKKLIRKNRTSVAVLHGEESEEQLGALAKDIFTYYGLGCRNVTKVFLPNGFDKDRLFQAFFPYQEIVNHNKYANNYDYNKAIYLLNKVDLLENGFLLLKADDGLHSPVGVLFYEEYKDWPVLKKKLEASADEIQAIVSAMDESRHLPFGQAQQPELWDYADGVDTLAFLQEI